jgi:hypothetical protein
MVGFGFGVISMGPLIGELLLNCIKKLPFHFRYTQDVSLYERAGLARLINAILSA